MYTANQKESMSTAKSGSPLFLQFSDQMKKLIADENELLNTIEEKLRGIINRPRSSNKAESHPVKQIESFIDELESFTITSGTNNSRLREICNQINELI